MIFPFACAGKRKKEKKKGALRPFTPGKKTSRDGVGQLATAMGAAKKDLFSPLLLKKKGKGEETGQIKRNEGLWKERMEAHLHLSTSGKRGGRNN